MKKIIIIGAIILLIVMFATCKRTIKHRLDWRMIGKDTTILSPKEILTFEWDTMYIFNRFNRELWNKYKRHNLTEPDFTRFIICTRNGKEVYREEEYKVSEPCKVSFITDDIGHEKLTDTIYPNMKFQIVRENYGYSMFLINNKK